MKPDTITAICSVIVASLALFVSIWQGYETRHHNKLSVTPKLEITRDLRIGEEVGMFIESVGLGPAIVKSFAISIGGVEYVADSNLKWIQILNQSGIQEEWVQFYAFGSNTFFPEGRKDFLLKAASKDIDSDAVGKFKTATDEMEIVIVYESIYREKEFTVRWTRP